MGSSRQVKYHQTLKWRNPIVLIGFMGSGKSTVGPLLASLCGLPFADLDKKIEARAGRPVFKIFESQGEAGFRTLETAELKRQLRTAQIIAAGGGVLTSPANRALLRRQGVVVLWLNVSWRALWSRLRHSSKGQRPVLIDKQTARPKSQVVILKLWRERCVQYRKALPRNIVIRGNESSRATARRALAELETTFG